MSRAIARTSGNAASNINTKSLDVNTRHTTYSAPSAPSTKYTTSSAPSTKYTTSSTPSFDPSDVGRRVDMSTAAKRTEVVEGIKKLETDTFSARFGDTVKKSSFYQKNQGKLLTMGITATAAAGWFGVLLAQGYSPAEAWAKMTETVEDWFEAAAGAAGSGASAATKAALKAAWAAFVVFVHNAVGHKMFDDTEGTERALKSVFLFLFLYKLLGFFGINLVTLPFKILFGLLGGMKKN